MKESEQTALAQQGAERDAHHNSRQHERQNDESPGDSTTAEPQPIENVRYG